MAELDWLDQTRKGYLHAYLIAPTNPDHVYGELEGVDWAASSVTAGYYTDTRTSGELTYVGDGWKPRGAFIRIVYEIPEWDYTREIGTYAPVKDPAKRSNGQWTTTLELHSMPYTMSLDIATCPTQIAAGASILTAMRKELEAAGRAYIFKAANDYRTTSPKLMETGKSRLSRLFELCQMSDNRLDVDGHGRMIIEPYVEPAKRPIVARIDLDDPRGIAYDDVQRSTNWLEMPTTAAVQYTFSEKGSDGKMAQREINAAVSVTATNHASRTVRGYNIVDFHSITELTPATGAGAQAKAKQYLENDAYEKIEWELKSKFLPIWEGDVIELVIPDGDPDYAGVRRCLVKNVDIAFPSMDMTLTLKETNSLDEED